MAAEGHAIGIHTWSHTPGFPMLRSGAMAADILRCRESLREITGVETDLFRPPYGVTNPMVARAVKRTGSRCVGWSIRSLDTLRQRSREAVARRIRRRLGDGKVILLHDDRPGAERLLAMVLNDLQRGGLPHGDRMRTV
jgi:peptidoglycan-N-acetylglucosamine deacetylase